MRMMRAMLAAGVAMMVAAPIAAQSTFPTRASGVRAGGSVLMICDANASNCAPAAPTNPMPVTAMGGGASSSATSQSVVPATDSAPFPVVGNVAAGSADSGAPVKIGGVVTTNLGFSADGVRVDLITDSRRQLRVVAGGAAQAPVDTGTQVFLSYPPGVGSGSAFPSGSLGYVWNGSNVIAARGDTSGAFIGASQFWTESTAALAASGTLTGTLRSNGGTAGGVGSRFAFFTASAFSDVAGGTLYVDVTVDGGTTWRQVGSVALVAGSSATLKVPVTAAGYRGRVINGANAQGAALVTTSYSVN